MAEEQVNQTGDQAQAGLGWRAALPDEFKEHEFVKTFQKPGDFVKAAIDIKTDREALKTQLANSIPKLKADAKPEEREAYFKALGRPDKPEEYEFEGDTLDPKSVDWARQTFYRLGIPKDLAKSIGSEFNQYQKAQIDAFKANAEKEEKAADAKLKADLGDKYPATKELATRLWNKVFAKDKDALAFLATPTREGMLLGSNPFFVRMFAELAKITGEDVSSAGSPPQDKAKEGLESFYDKSPGMFDPSKR